MNSSKLMSPEPSSSKAWHTLKSSSESSKSTLHFCCTCSSMVGDAACIAFSTKMPVITLKMAPWKKNTKKTNNAAFHCPVCLKISKASPQSSPPVLAFHKVIIASKTEPNNLIMSPRVSSSKSSVSRALVINRTKVSPKMCTMKASKIKDHNKVGQAQPISEANIKRNSLKNRTARNTFKSREILSKRMMRNEDIILHLLATTSMQAAMMRTKSKMFQ
mmetsp:Transcript_10261/g.25674  ORF Transcript_10261/g.25674 Transcript_10261/m.25674 type:complete len:218 (+) Transcript_10261:75-728(+)